MITIWHRDERRRRNKSNIRPNLLMGQRFLVSRSVGAKIIASARLEPNDTVLEIGSGRGELTMGLARAAGRVIAVEKDPRLIAILRQRLARQGVRNITLIHGDILKILASGSITSNPYKVVANIPYYLTSRLIRKLLEAEHPPEEILLMVQREVAERIAAEPPRMNLSGLAVQAYGRPEILFWVPAEAFRPRPKVDSAFIRISDISREFFLRHRISPAAFFTVLRAAFRGKRKTVENALAKNLPRPKARIAAITERLGLAGKRPEQLTLDDWCKLVAAIKPVVS